MTDRYENIRKALEMGPTPGPWGFTELPRDMQRDGYKFAISRRGIGWRFAQIAHEMKSVANATYITACDPDTIRELLEERDALSAEVERLAEALRLAEEHINDLTPEWYSAGQRVLAGIRAALSAAERSDGRCR